MESNLIPHDEHLIVRHMGEHMDLDFIGTDHIYMTSSVLVTFWILKEFIKALEQAFGKGELDIHVETFDCVGIRHAITDAGYTMYQIEYIGQLRPISNHALTPWRDDDGADPIKDVLDEFDIPGLKYFKVDRMHLGEKRNYMNSTAIIETPAGQDQLYYIVSVLSNVLRKNSAQDHRDLARAIHQRLRGDAGRREDTLDFVQWKQGGRLRRRRRRARGRAPRSGTRRR